MIMLACAVCSSHAQSQTDVLSPAVSASVRGVVEDSSDPFDVLINLPHGRAYYDNGQYQRSASAFQSVLLHDPNIAEARLGYAEALYALGALRDSRDAMIGLDSQTLSIPQHERAIALGRLIKAALGPDTTTVQELESAIKTQSNPIREHAALARELDRRLRWVDSQRAYIGAIQKYPESAVLRNNFGVSLLRRGLLDMARQQFKQANELDPQKRLYENNLQITNLLAGNLDAGLDSLTNARRAALLTDGASLLASLGRDTEARAIFKKAVEENSSHNTVSVMGSHGPLN
jgi:Tfp pilus assembly protein PilF